jgi:hypothetical protein
MILPTARRAWYAWGHPAGLGGFVRRTASTDARHHAPTTRRPRGTPHAISAFRSAAQSETPQVDTAIALPGLVV